MPKPPIQKSLQNSGQKTIMDQWRILRRGAYAANNCFSYKALSPRAIGDLARLCYTGYGQWTASVAQ